jgi:hypothetical protein
MADDCGCEPGEPGEPEEEDRNVAFPELAEMGNLQIAASVLVQGGAAAAARRIDRADQISGDSQSSWTIAMQMPTNNAALAMRTASESGGGSTRMERNPPYITTTPIISTPKDV